MCVGCAPELRDWQSVYNEALMVLMHNDWDWKEAKVKAEEIADAYVHRANQEAEDVLRQLRKE